MTLVPYRGRGLAKAVVVQALAESRAAGHDFTFLVATADDWPKQLYRKLGFVTAGSIWNFLAAGGTMMGGMCYALGSVLAILAVAAPLASAGHEQNRPAHVSWADKNHAFATDPFGKKWKCAPRGARSYVVTLCGDEQRWQALVDRLQRGRRDKGFDSLVEIFSVWRGPSRYGAFDLAGESDAGGGDVVYVLATAAEAGMRTTRSSTGCGTNARPTCRQERCARAACTSTRTTRNCLSYRR